jgi:hypothetical protein
VKEAGENSEEEARGSTQEKKGLNAASDMARKRTAAQGRRGVWLRVLSVLK